MTALARRRAHLQRIERLGMIRGLVVGSFAGLRDACAYQMRDRRDRSSWSPTLTVEYTAPLNPEHRARLRAECPWMRLRAIRLPRVGT